MSTTANAGTWTDLQPALSEGSLKAVAAKGFDRMTPVQASAIPLFLKNKDVAAQAVTGSGKTLAFLLPVFEMLNRRADALRHDQIGALIVLPTRELAQQVHELAQFINHTGFGDTYSVQLFTGGVHLDEHLAAARKHGAQIAVGTPGRLDELMTQLAGELDLRELEVLVLDEADRLLEMGFQRQISSLLARLPKQRRTGLFSATQTEQVRDLIRAGLRNPVRVVVKVQDAESRAESKMPLSLANYYTVVPLRSKPGRLMEFITQHAESKIIVYFLTCAAVDYYASLYAQHRRLQKRDVTVFPLHGKMHTKKRKAVYRRFVEHHEGGAVLMATDVAARGLDVPDVDWIVQFDAPQDPAMFVHRCGRTARAGRAGTALVYLTPDEVEYSDYLRVCNIPVAEWPEDGEREEGSEREEGEGEGEDTEAEDWAAKAEERREADAEEVVETFKRMCTKDHDLVDKASLAYVSYVRAYGQHQLQYIFRLAKLDLGELAQAFALLKLPSMPELRRAKVSYAEWEHSLDTVPYKNKQRERQRQERLANKEQLQEKKRAALALKREKQRQHSSWSEQVDRKEKKKERRSKKERKREAKRKREELEREQNEEEDGHQQQKDMAGGDGFDDDDDDEDDMEAEIRLMKKLKKGKISKKEFDVQVAALDAGMEMKHESKKGGSSSSSSSTGANADGGDDAMVEEKDKAAAAEAETTESSTKKKKKKKKRKVQPIRASED